MTPPKVFISYSHDTVAHRDWVKRLATALRTAGIDAYFDGWGVRLGEDLAFFMESSFSDSDRILCICTDNYNDRANSKKGGVGFESTYIRGEYLSNPHSSKMIPIIRNVTSDEKLPRCLVGKTYIDFTNDEEYDDKLEELMRHLLSAELETMPELGTNPFLYEEEEKAIGRQRPSEFFYERFCIAFPGTRGQIDFCEKEAIQRLLVFLQPPLIGMGKTPIWYWGRGNMYIKKCSQLDGCTLLLDHDELKIEEISAVRSHTLNRYFIYVCCSESAPTGVYPESAPGVRGNISYEEYGLYNGHFLTREEYDDGAVIINGEHVDCAGKTELRRRYTSRYNFVIAPQDSPINNGEVDLHLEGLLDNLLNGNNSVDDLIAFINKLPERTR